MRITVTIDDPVAELLEFVGNKSAYITALIERAHRDWVASLAVLKSWGWTGEQLEACCQALSGLHAIHALPASTMLRAELSDADRLGHLTVESGAWRAQVADVDDVQARAIWLITQEFWAGNLALQKRLALR